MPTLDKLGRADIVSHFTQSSLKRAGHYLRRVSEPVRSGETLSAQVLGTGRYDVEIDVGPAGIQARCTCPYSWSGFCKHVGAVLLKWINEPEDFVTRPVQEANTLQDLPVVSVSPTPTFRYEEPPAWSSVGFAEQIEDDLGQYAEWLQEYKLRELRDMASALGFRPKGTRKAEIAQQIAEFVIDPGQLHGRVQALDAEHRHVLRALLMLDVVQRLDHSELGQVASYWGELAQHKTLDVYLQQLCGLGLVIPAGFSPGRSTWGEFVPWAVSRHLSAVVGSPLPSSSDLPDEPAPGLELADPLAFVRTTNQILLMLEQTPIPLRPPMPRPHVERYYSQLAGWDYVPAEILQAQENRQLRFHGSLVLTVPPPAYALPDQAIRRLAPITGGEQQLNFIYALLLAAGVVQPGSPVTLWPEVKKAFLQRKELAQQAVLARSYFEMTNWSVLWDLLRAEGGIQLKRRLSSYQPERLRLNLTKFRDLVLRVLALLPDMQWVTLDDLSGLMQRIWPRFDQQVFGQSYYGRRDPAWFLVAAESGQELQPGRVADWELAQGAFIRQMLMGPLHWLGLVDLYRPQGKLVAVRLHGLADLYWDRVDVIPVPPQIETRAEAAVPASDLVSVDNGTIKVSPSAVSAQAHNLLDRMARLELASPDQFVYQLEARAAYESFEEGFSLPQILDEWERLLPVPMPDSMGEQLASWWASYGRVRIYEKLTVVEFADDLALAEMKAVTSLDQYLIAEISPRLVIIRQEGIVELTAELEKAGYTPKQEPSA